MVVTSDEWAETKGDNNGFWLWWSGGLDQEDGVSCLEESRQGLAPTLPSERSCAILLHISSFRTIIICHSVISRAISTRFRSSPWRSRYRITAHHHLNTIIRIQEKKHIKRVSKYFTSFPPFFTYFHRKIFQVLPKFFCCIIWKLVHHIRLRYQKL